MLAMDAKTQKIKPNPKHFLMTDEALEAVNKIDGHNVRSYLFF